MDVPDLVRERLGDETVHATVNLGNDDALCLTPTRTILYRGEGLLSDERVAEFPHDTERLTVTESRRKAKFQFEYIAGTESFTVPRDRADSVLERVMGGLLRVANVAEPDERVAGVYRFSELTLVITDRRVVKHIGAAVWDEDYEVFPFEDVTGLGFEDGSVATQIVLGIDGRPQRIKAPNEKAPLVRQTLQEALFSYHDVSSIEELNERLGPNESEPELGDEPAGYGLDADIDPLVGGSTEPTDEELSSPETPEGGRPRSMDVDPRRSGTEAGADSTESERSRPAAPDASASDAGHQPTADSKADDQPVATAVGAPVADDEAPEEQPRPASASTSPPITDDQVRTLETELADLRAAVEEQNDLLEEQHEVIERLVATLED